LFPDSGSSRNAATSPGRQPLPSAGAVASEQYQPEQDQGQERGNVHGRGM